MTKEREYSKSGKWVDTKTGQVVDQEPEEGTLLVPAGGELTPARRAAVERAEAQAPPQPEETEPEQEEQASTDEGQPVEAATETEDVETAAEPAVSPKPRGKR